MSMIRDAGMSIFECVCMECGCTRVQEQANKTPRCYERVRSLLDVLGDALCIHVSDDPRNSSAGQLPRPPVLTSRQLFSSHFWKF